MKKKIKKKNNKDKLIRQRERAAETRLRSRQTFPRMRFSQHAGQLRCRLLEHGLHLREKDQHPHWGDVTFLYATEGKALQVSPSPNAVRIAVLLKCIACKTHTEKSAFCIHVPIANWWVRVCFFWCYYRFRACLESVLIQVVWSFHTWEQTGNAPVSGFGCVCVCMCMYVSVCTLLPLQPHSHSVFVLGFVHLFFLSLLFSYTQSMGICHCTWEKERVPVPWPSLPNVTQQQQQQLVFLDGFTVGEQLNVDAPGNT